MQFSLWKKVITREAEVVGVLNYPKDENEWLGAFNKDIYNHKTAFIKQMAIFKCHMARNNKNSGNNKSEKP